MRRRHRCQCRQGVEPDEETAEGHGQLVFVVERGSFSSFYALGVAVEHGLAVRCSEA